MTVLYICSMVKVAKRGYYNVEIIDYYTAGGKNLIANYLDKLPPKEQAEGYRIRQSIMDDGLLALVILNTRQLKGKLWEIKFANNRIMYVVRDEESIYFLHACRKQKNKTEKHELDKAIKRARICGLKIE